MLADRSRLEQQQERLFYVHRRRAMALTFDDEFLHVLDLPIEFGQLPLQAGNAFANPLGIVSFH